MRNTVAVLDATDTERALLVGLSLGAATSLFTATLHPERVAGVVAIGSTIPLLVAGHPWMATPFDEDPGTDAGWERWTRASWQRDFPGFVEHFSREMFPEPHSEKQIEDCVGWGLDCGRAVLEATMDSPPGYTTREQAEALVSGVRCPVLAHPRRRRPHLAARVRAPRRRADRRRARGARGLRPRARSRATRCASTC